MEANSQEAALAVARSIDTVMCLLRFGGTNSRESTLFPSPKSCVEGTQGPLTPSSGSRTVREPQGQAQAGQGRRGGEFSADANNTTSRKP